MSSSREDEPGPGPAEGGRPTGAADPAVLRPLALVGLRASGKSTVGRALAERLGRPFVDLDDALAQRFGETGEGAGAVLRRVGEPRFRELEREVLRDALGRSDGPVIGTGGGVVERADNRADLVSNCHGIWLRAAPELLVRRLSRDATDRPPLTELDPAAEVHALGERRAPLYAEVAEVTIDVDGLDVMTLLERIVSQFER